MNGNLSKIIAAVVAFVAIIFIVKYFKANFSVTPQESQKGITEVMSEDDKRLRPTEKEIAGAPEAPEPNSGLSERTRDQAAQFRALSQEESVAAEQIFEMALAQRKIARLPGMNYKQMVDYCRQLMQKFPGTVFEEKARIMLSEVPADQRAVYNITEQEIKPKK